MKTPHFISSLAPALFMALLFCKPAFSQSLPEPGNFLERFGFEWDVSQSDWADATDRTVGFYENGERVKEENYVRGAGDPWVYRDCTYRFLSGGRLDSTAYYIIDSVDHVTEVPFSRAHFYYSNGVLVTQDYFSWNPFVSAWGLSSRYVWELDEQGRYKKRLGYNVSGWDLVLADSMVYEYGGMKDSIVLYTNSPGGMVADYKEVHELDNLDRMGVFVSYLASGGQFTPVFKRLYTYGSDPDQPETELIYQWMGAGWLLAGRISNEYDAEGRLERQSHARDVNNEWVVYFDALFEYDTEGRLVVQEHRVVENNLERGEHRDEYVYDWPAGVEGLVRGMGVRVYPVPSSGVVNFELGAGGVIGSLRVHSASGVLLEEVDGAGGSVRVDVSGWPSGSYLYYVQTSEGGLHTGVFLR